ncbi:phosphatase PAP2 family protein [Sphingomonas sp.]|uniref:phosphatase PAP2 family protein n=1 Tax=Sphingomonas sp. TaxID=28214 RepID=UPI00286C7C85|nr:phosphatase PAP2 family protein [Sphingomonas sp.]
MAFAGTGPLDHRLLAALYTADRPAMRGAVIGITNLGSWPVLVTLTLIGLGWLLYRRQVRLALLLLATTLIGRMLADLLKLGIGRHRPQDEVHLVTVRDLSFPSGHAANTMIVFLSLALLVAPPRFRHLAVPVALFGTGAVGITRPMLGVHWPSDVVGGWAFGAAWVLLMLGLAERLGQADTAGFNSQGREQ